MERALKAIAAKRGYSKERIGAFVYGTMRKTGWTPSTQKKSKKHKILAEYKKRLKKT